jgi:hypothetical protein
VNIVPEAALFAFADHGRIPDTSPLDGVNCEIILARFAGSGIDPAK